MTREQVPDLEPVREALRGEIDDIEPLVALATARNPRLRARVKALEAAVEQIPQAGAAPVPSLRLGMMLTTADFASRVVEQMLAWSQTLVLRSRLDVRALAAAEQAFEKAAELREEVLALRLEIIAAASALERLDRTATAIGDNAALTRHLIVVARSMLAAGRESQQAVLRTGLRLSQLEARLLELARERAEVEAQLAELLGAAEPLAVGRVTLRREPLLQPNLTVVIEQALARRPTLTASRHRLRADVAVLRLAELGGIPDPMLMLEYGYRRPERMGSLRPEIAVELPFLTPGRRQAEIEQARAMLGEGVQEHRARQAAVAGEVAAAHAHLAEAISSVRLYDERLRTEAEAAWRAALAGYSTGAVDYTAALEALMTRNEVEVEYHSATFRLRLAVEELRRAVGGSETTAVGGQPSDQRQ